MLWNFFNCYLSGRHDFGMWCEPGQIFLRCVHCGKRSSGWAVERKGPAAPVRATVATTVATTVPTGARVVPFTRAAAS